jgi:hypothetical protein
MSMNLTTFVKENKFLRHIYDRLIRVLEIVPFYLVKEGLSKEQNPNIKPKLDNYAVVFLDASDIKAVAAHTDVHESEEELLSRLTNDCLCLGIKHNARVIAYTWCNLRQCKYEQRLSFPLKDDEAYLFDARTLGDYRGKAVAPFLRYQLYLRLEEMGRTRLYSTTSAFNTSAKKFKQRLDARTLKLFLFIHLFKKFYY